MVTNMDKKEKFIRDSVYGDIKLNDFEVKVMDMPQFQRIRRIKQLGLINLIYPGANHSRFEHCIGTMNLSSKLATKLEWQVFSMMSVMVHFHMYQKEYYHFLMKNLQNMSLKKHQCTIYLMKNLTLKKLLK